MTLQPDDDFPVYSDVPDNAVVRRLRSEIPAEHKKTTDTRLQWLWMQRLAVTMNIKLNSKDPLDVMAANLTIAAAWTNYMPSIETLIRRLEGGPVSDQTMVEQDSMPL